MPVLQQFSRCKLVKCDVSWGGNMHPCEGDGEPGTDMADMALKAATCCVMVTQSEFRAFRTQWTKRCSAAGACTTIPVQLAVDCWHLPQALHPRKIFFVDLPFSEPSSADLFVVQEPFVTWKDEGGTRTENALGQSQENSDWSAALFQTLLPQNSG